MKAKKSDKRLQLIEKDFQSAYKIYLEINELILDLDRMKYQLIRELVDYSITYKDEKDSFYRDDY